MSREIEIEIDATAIINNCKLVSREGYAYPALIALGWREVQVVEVESVLLQAPPGWGEQD